MPYKANKNEKEVLKFWDENKIFEKSVESKSKDEPYVFYDGPPFATGLPHYGHIVASLIKDTVPRFWTMRGYRVERVWGWDCHGLPIENIIEKELDLKTKDDIEKFGIAKFNEAARSKVLMYADEWKKTVHRMGRWVDMDNAYKTMDIEYMESIWWVFKQLWDKKLIYEGYKSMHICPRCVTPLSNFEVTQNYKDIKDISVVAKFTVHSGQFTEKLNLDGNLYILAWTTTPWTLPGNVLLAVGEDIEYLVVNIDGKEGSYIVAKDRVEDIVGDEKFEVKKEIKGSELVGLEYEPLFPYFADTENAFRVVAADFVNTEEGTGIVHVAPAFGQDDYELGQREETGWIQHVTMEGKFTEDVSDFAGQEVKPKDDHSKADVEILKWLAANNKLFSKMKYEHSYPHCWRCDTPLLNYSTASWFVKVTDLKEDLIENNKEITWVPEHIKEGRFGKWLEGAKDWAISRNRYWGTPLPVWRCQTENQKSEIRNQKFCDNLVIIGSAEELEKRTNQKVDDLHKHIVDQMEFECDKCGGTMKRVPEVLDCWFESGSMPYGQMHYPFDNKQKFEKGFPAEFIAEGQDQTRGWFYTLHVLATALTRGSEPSIPVGRTTSSFKNVIVNGIVLAEDGKKMSKRLQNYPDPMEVLEKYGADAMRYYLVSSPVMHAESLNFSEEGVREVYNKVCNTLWNVFSFYRMFSTDSTDLKTDYADSENVLDRWVLAKLNILIRDVTKGMEEYKLAEASRPILEFVTELSQWYVRRSRDRFKGEDERDKQAAITTLREVLLTLSKVMAPFTPFMAEQIYQYTVGSSQPTGFGDSVHLQEWPEVDNSKIDSKILKDMEMVRKIVELGLSARKDAGVKVRQPLSQLAINNEQLTKDLLEIIADELNVKSVEMIDSASQGKDWVEKEDGNLKVALNVKIDEELKKEGMVREIVRAINLIRKEKGYTIDDRIKVSYKTSDPMLSVVLADFNDEICKGVLADEIIEGEGEKEVEVNDSTVSLKVESV
ncbi:MAG: isoleucine--tRNA ligase [Candidatus Magasanikbacteria bacterium]|nr:isoleucine--tRNA ligase [Candidatus Magasanikbacteria bacterium]